MDNENQTRAGGGRSASRSQSRGPQSRGSGSTATKRRRRRWPWVVGILGCLILGLAAAGALFYKQATKVRDELTAAKQNATTMRDAVRRGDDPALKTAAASFQQHANTANDTVGGPLWSFFGAMPWAGDNVDAVRKTAQATHTISEESLPAIVKVAGVLKLSSLKVAGGGINLKPLQDAEPQLPAIDAGFTKAREQIQGIDQSNLVDKVKEPVHDLTSLLDSTAPTLTEVKRDLPMILDMAGNSGERRYALVLATNAEIRAAGGNAANISVVKVDHGKITPETNAEIATKSEVYYELPAATKTLYEWDTAKLAQNFTRTPDFPTSSKMFQAAYAKQTGGSKLDGVIQIDPVVFQRILGISGPIKSPEGKVLTSTNTADYLYAGVYQEFPSTGPSNGYLGKMSESFMSTFAQGGWDPVEMFKTLHQSTDDQRVHVWMDDAKLQDVVRHYHLLSGELVPNNEGVTQVGIYLNNAEYSKLDYYLTTAADVTCDASDRSVTETLTLTNSAPLSGLTRYQLGIRNDRQYHLPKTTMMLDSLAFAVPGGNITMDPKQNDFPDSVRSGIENGRQGRSVTVALPAGETKKVTYTTTLPQGPLGPLQVRYSPTTKDTKVTVAPSCSGLFAKN